MHWKKKLARERNIIITKTWGWELVKSRFWKWIWSFSPLFLLSFCVPHNEVSLSPPSFLYWWMQRDRIHHWIQDPSKKEEGVQTLISSYIYIGKGNFERRKKLGRFTLWCEINCRESRRLFDNKLVCFLIEPERASALNANSLILILCFPFLDC